jgi:hypothetical protein
MLWRQRGLDTKTRRSERRREKHKPRRAHLFSFCAASRREQALQANISYHYYASGHVVYLNEEALRQFHSDVAAFVRESVAAGRP